MAEKKKTLVLIDGNALIHRAYHALPPLTTKKGEVVNAVYGFTLTLLSVLEKFKPEYIAASFDLAGPTFRHKQFADYKATRVKGPDDLYAQIPRVKELTRAFNIPIYEQAGFEADDCVGTLARQAEKENVEVIIVTGDNDALQLVTPLTKVFTLRKGIKDTVLYDEQAVEAKYGFFPAQIPDYKGLAGDASDNIPGVAGIGAKTATDLLKRFGTLENIYAALLEVKESIRKKLETDKESAFLSKELGAIDTAAPVALDLPACVSRDFDRDTVTRLFQELGFFSLIKRISGSQESGIKEKRKSAQGGSASGGKKKKITTQEDLEKFLGKAETVAVYVEQAQGTLFGAGIESVHVAVTPGEEAMIAWNEQTKRFLKEFLEDERRKKTVYDGKALLHLFQKEGIAMKGIGFDVMIAAYLLNSGGNVELGYLVLEVCGEEEITMPAEKLLVLRETYDERIDEVSETQKDGKTLRLIFEKIEMPLLAVLFEVETNGVYLNTGKFRILSEELKEELASLEKDIYEFSGREFNINSPKQLSEILFQDLKIPTTNIKKTKTGISTASMELQKLQAYPIVAKIESYRELFKLKTTYLDALPLLVGGDGRLHTTFHQAVAATGRLSSSDPNLQNIPARNSWSERIRGAFEAGAGNVLIGADYSQIELRVMAHLSGDKALCEAFRKGEDVHTTTASVVYKVKPEEVTADMRRQAKVFNFGIMYGMGSFGLSQAAQIEQKVAAQFIAAYFKKFAGVAKFIEEMKQGARERGYVETELGRRRYTPEIVSQNVQVARSAERMAINMPIQGLAADIMKLAMLKAQELVDNFNNDAHPPASQSEAFRARMVLQVHDELIFEAKAGHAEAFAARLKESMESAYTLKVPLIVETAIGKNWGEI
ncbi:MAG: DNA polymerase I [Patescibacteria group bacterium]